MQPTINQLKDEKSYIKSKSVSSFLSSEEVILLKKLISHHKSKIDEEKANVIAITGGVLIAIFFTGSFFIGILQNDVSNDFLLFSTVFIFYIASNVLALLIASFYRAVFANLNSREVTTSDEEQLLDSFKNGRKRYQRKKSDN
ncbi:MAG: hypothetical protein PHT30_03820 [Bacilli bacterium]|nr:hypothetical protein [Bacilli bacterium]